MPEHDWDVQLSAQTELASQPVAAAIILDGGELAAAVLAKAVSYGPNGTLDIARLDPIQASALLRQFLPTTPLPDEFDLTLSSGVVYWVKNAQATPPSWIPAALENQANLQSGLNVLADVRIRLAGEDLPSFSAAVGVSGQDEGGVAYRGQLDKPLTLGSFLEISGTTERGPLVQGFAGGADPHWEINASLEMFGAGPLDLTLGARQGEDGQKISATVKATSLGPYKKSVSLTLTWDGTNGFNLTGFDGLDFPDGIPAKDFITALEKSFADRNCGLVKLALGKALTTKFAVTPHLTTSKPNVPGALDNSFAYVVLDGTYSIYAAGNLVVNVPLPTLALSIPAPQGFNFADLATLVEKTILTNAELVVEELWKQPRSMALFLGVFLAKKALQDLANELTCDGIKELLEEFADLLTGGLNSITDAAAAFGGIFGSIVSAGCGSSSGNGGSVGVLGGSISPPGHVTWSHSPGSDDLRLTWDTVTGTVDYLVELWYQAGHPVGQKTILKVIPAGTTSAALAVPADAADGTMTCQVIARSGSPLFGDSAPASPSPSIVKLAAPASVDAAYVPAEDQLSVSWPTVTDAAGYLVQVLSPAGPVLTSASMDHAHTSTAIDWAAIGASACLAAVTATGDASHLDSSVTNAASSVTRVRGISFWRIGDDFRVG